MANIYTKSIDGHIVLTIRIPHTFEVDAHDEVYEDKYGTKYVEEEYEYGPDDVLEYRPNQHANEIKRDIQYLKNRGWVVEEIDVEEC